MRASHQIFFLLSIQVNLVCGGQPVPNCQRTLFFPQNLESGKALLNHIISNLTVTKKTDCRSQCFMNNDCVSYNVGEASPAVGMICQLNDADRYQYPGDFKSVSGFSYQGTKSACHPNTCTKYAKCQDGFGEKNYRCVCLPGVQGEDCKQDIDECQTNTHNCSSTGGQCNNTFGSFNCSCRDGFTGDGYNCVDINECLSSVCDEVNGYCTNLPGSFKCYCKDGYSLGDGNNCTDIDECNGTSHGCPVTHPEHGGLVHCINTLGSFKCECKPGFKEPGYCNKEMEHHTQVAPRILCVGTKDDQFGEFTIPETGIIVRFKFYHKSGLVTSNKNYPVNKGFWGPSSGNNDKLNFFITDVNGNRISPSPDYDKWTNNYKYSFRIDGKTVNQTALDMPQTSWPRKSYEAGTKFRVWFGEDLLNHTEGDNEGITCMSVVVAYRRVT